MTPVTAAVATELRDGLLQDLIALGLLVRIAERDLSDERAATVGSVLTTAASTIGAGVAQLRTVIDRLGPAR
jgi:signal transduction histidine kinase